MIDVSAYQGTINWARVHASGVRRAYIKWGEHTIDPQAVRNIETARARGIEVGLYYFAHPSQSPAVAASWFLRTAEPHLHPGDLPPVLDLELTEGQDWAQLTHWAQAWLEPVSHTTGCRAAFYSYASFISSITLPAGTPVWGADLAPVFTPPASWFLHQYSFTGRVPGIQGHVDLDRFYWDPARVGSGQKGAA